MSVITVLTSLLLLMISPWLPSPVTSTIIPDESQSSAMTCNSCCQGPGGIPGIPGAAGIPGAPGGFGPPGPAGPKGELGLSVNGQKGDVGETGLLGPRGELGLRGAPGKVGPMGIQGPRGEDGLKGAVGNQGPKGESGRVSFAGFTVAKTQPQSGIGIVTFDTVISDVAGDYDTNTNKFTCNIPGYYLFTFTIGSIDNNYPWVKLVHNGNEIVGMHTTPSGTSNYRNTGSNSALILLATGDQVWLRNKYNTQIHSSWKWTTFTGVLLHAV